MWYFDLLAVASIIFISGSLVVKLRVESSASIGVPVPGGLMGRFSRWLQNPIAIVIFVAAGLFVTFAALCSVMLPILSNRYVWIGAIAATVYFIIGGLWLHVLE